MHFGAKKVLNGAANWVDFGVYTLHPPLHLSRQKLHQQQIEAQGVG